MSTSAESYLRFVFETADALTLKWRQYTADELVRVCLAHIPEKPQGEAWKRQILLAMRAVLSEARNRKGLEARLSAMNRYASTHPDRDALVTDLGRRALLGELRVVPTDTADAYPRFADQLGRIYEGNLTPDDLWRQAWQRTAAILNISLSETP